MSFLDRLFGRKDYIEVDYDAPVEEVVEQGGFGWVAEEWHTSRFTSANYPTTLAGRRRLVMHLVSCKGVSIEKGLQQLDTSKYRPAELRELLAFGAAYPMRQKEFRIVAPGTQVHPRPEHPLAAPELAWGGLGRILGLVSMTWDQGGTEWMLLAVERA